MIRIGLVSDTHVPEAGPDLPASAYAALAGWDATARLIVRLGDPFTELTALAAEVRADVIVTGAPGSVLGRVMPTLPSRVVRRKQWPVVVIP